MIHMLAMQSQRRGIYVGQANERAARLKILFHIRDERSCQRIKTLVGIHVLNGPEWVGAFLDQGNSGSIPVDIKDGHQRWARIPKISVTDRTWGIGNRAHNFRRTI